jgi:hypothetical protein
MEHGSNTDFTMIAAHPCFIRGSIFPSSVLDAMPETWVRAGCLSDLPNVTAGVRSAFQIAAANSGSGATRLDKNL